MTRGDLAGLRNKRLMLVHGMRDRRVLLENTMSLSERLVEENIMFQQKVWKCTHNRIANFATPPKKMLVLKTLKVYMICNALENASDGLIKISLFTQKIVPPKNFRPNFCCLCVRPKLGRQIYSEF